MPHQHVTTQYACVYGSKLSKKVIYRYVINHSAAFPEKAYESPSIYPTPEAAAQARDEHLIRLFGPQRARSLFTKRRLVKSPPPIASDTGHDGSRGRSPSSSQEGERLPTPASRDTYEQSHQIPAKGPPFHNILRTAQSPSPPSGNGKPRAASTASYTSSSRMPETPDVSNTAPTVEIRLGYGIGLGLAHGLGLGSSGVPEHFPSNPPPSLARTLAEDLAALASSFARMEREASPSAPQPAAPAAARGPPRPMEEDEVDVIHDLPHHRPRPPSAEEGGSNKRRRVLGSLLMHLASVAASSD